MTEQFRDCFVVSQLDKTLKTNSVSNSLFISREKKVMMLWKDYCVILMNFHKNYLDLYKNGSIDCFWNICLYLIDFLVMMPN